MKITHKIDDFLYTIFPSVEKGDHQSLKDALKEYYTYGPYNPKVSIKDNWISIEIDTSTIVLQDADYKKAIAFCEQGKYSQAKQILINLIKDNPTISEYHRVLGQIMSDEGEHDEAINYLIDAMRWDSKNGWALLLMGNIFAKHKNDVKTAMKYYDQALIANPKDNITVNNIGANLMQQGKLDEAKKYFKNAHEINENYPNTHFALGMIADIEGDLHTAFKNTIQAIRLNNKKDLLYQNSVKQAFKIAQKITATKIGEKVYEDYKHKLEYIGGRKIDIKADENIPTAAKIEFAENYNRENHLVRFKPSYQAVEHLIMHELVHLDFVIQARKEKLNLLFISTQNHKAEFIKGLEPTIKKFIKMGVAENAIADYSTSLFEGLNRQIFNAPIDLFIENHLHIEFIELRPIQFLSLYAILQEGLMAVTDKKIVDLSPKDIISKSKVYNLVNAIQFKELFGFDFIKDFNGTRTEIELATEFYEEYLQYKDDKEPAEEYEMVLHWAEDLKLDKYFELINEEEYRNKRTDIDALLTSIENDPFDLESNDTFKNREMDKFQRSQESIGVNMAVVMFMVDALKYFEAMPKEDIKRIAYDIAMQGTQGFNPDQNHYRINSIPDKTFSGYHILAYYYISWALAIPEMLSQLQLPYSEEYKLALSMHKSM